jgi:hypothetical protein
MDSTATVTVPLSEYLELLKFKEEFTKNKIPCVYNYNRSYAVFFSKDEALKEMSKQLKYEHERAELAYEKIGELSKEIERLKPVDEPVDEPKKRKFKLF